MEKINKIELSGMSYDIEDSTALHMGDLAGYATMADLSDLISSQTFGNLASFVENMYSTLNELQNRVSYLESGGNGPVDGEVLWGDTFPLSQGESDREGYILLTFDPNMGLRERIEEMSGNNFELYWEMDGPGFGNNLDNIYSNGFMYDLHDFGPNNNWNASFDFANGLIYISNNFIADNMNGNAPHNLMVTIKRAQGGNNQGGPGGNQVVMAEFPINSITLNDEGRKVVRLEGLSDLYANEQARANLQHGTFAFRALDGNGEVCFMNGWFSIANEEMEDFPAGPSGERMFINWIDGSLAFNNGFPDSAVKVLLVAQTNGGGNGGNNPPILQDLVLSQNGAVFFERHGLNIGPMDGNQYSFSFPAEELGEDGLQMNDYENVLVEYNFSNGPSGSYGVSPETLANNPGMLICNADGPVDKVEYFEVEDGAFIVFNVITRFGGGSNNGPQSIVFAEYNGLQLMSDETCHVAFTIPDLDNFRANAVGHDIGYSIHGNNTGSGCGSWYVGGENDVIDVMTGPDNNTFNVRIELSTGVCSLGGTAPNDIIDSIHFWYMA